MQLIVVTGLAAVAKTQISIALAQAGQAAGCQVALLDNADRPIHLPEVPTIRLPGGCVCCTLAGRLAPAIARLSSNLVLLPVSALAEPATLACVLDQLRAPNRNIITVAVTDKHTHNSYLATQLRAHADMTIGQEQEAQDLIRAVLNGP